VANGRLAPSVTLDRYETHRAIDRLRKYEGTLLRGLHDKIFRTWQLHGANPTITVPLTQRELEVMRRLGATSSPQVVYYKWFALYVHQSGEVYTQTTDRPPRKKTLRVPGSGRKKFTLHKLYRLPTNSKESEQFMARKKAAAKKVAEDEDIDELEGLEELEDDDEVEEPEVEEDEDEEEEKPKRRTRSRAKKTAEEKPARKRRTKAKVEEEDEEDEDEDEDDEEEEAPKKRTRSKKSTASTKSSSKKSSTKEKTGAAGRTTKEVTGGVGTSELAEAASEIADLEITGRDVRVYLRKNEIEKDEEHGRYYWPSAKNKTFVKLAKAIAKEYEE